MIGFSGLGCADEAAMPSLSGGAGASGQSAAPAPIAPPAGTGGTSGASAPAGSAGAPTAGSAGAPTAGSAGAPTAGSAGAPPDAGGQLDAEQWTVLTEENWMLPAGGEIEQRCADMVLAEDVYISAIRPIHPRGTHHTTLSVAEGETACSSLQVLQSGIIYAAGVGTEALRMPAGVAMKLSAGQVLRLGLHLYNVSDQPLSGVSGIEVIRVEPEDVEHEAELMLAGPLAFAILPGRQTITNNCIISEAQTVFALFPHMHQIGVHLKTTAVVGGESKVLHDAAYDFEEQYHIPLEPLALSLGDTITTECTYENDTSQVVGFGESSDTEMCFSILFRYPATRNSLCGGI